MHLRLSQRGRLRQCLLGCCVWLLLLHSSSAVSSVRIEHITIPAGTTQLRLDWNFLTNEFAPTYTDDSFTVSDSR